MNGDSFKKGDKVIFNWDNEKHQGVVIGGPYKFVNENELFADVLIYDYKEEISINIKYLEKIEG